MTPRGLASGLSGPGRPYKSYRLPALLELPEESCFSDLLLEHSRRVPVLLGAARSARRHEDLPALGARLYYKLLPPCWARGCGAQFCEHAAP